MMGRSIRALGLPDSEFIFFAVALPNRLSFPNIHQDMPVLSLNPIYVAPIAYGIRARPFVICLLSSLPGPSVLARLRRVRP